VIVIPAIDLRAGRCVRLAQGDYARETVYRDDPVAVALDWQRAGARWIHVVDLDGAREGYPAQRDLIIRIVQAVSVPVQAGGGIRTAEHAAALLEGGVTRVVLGTVAVEQPELVSSLVSQWGPERIVVGVDARGGKVAVRGWLDTTETTAIDLIQAMAARGLTQVVYTDIERDGTLTEPNYAEIAAVAATGVRVIASGGVSGIEQLNRLAQLPGVEAAIVGRALYTGDVVLGPEQWDLTSSAAATGGVPR
jgi:phosphoribosylformimino-5-aminoimidazole carboxamide ribotide isomerase